MAGTDINLIAQQIFTNLSSRDGLNDDNIGLRDDGSYDNSIWNSFADVAGENRVDNYIKKEDALQMITSALRRAANDNELFKKIALAGGVMIENGAEICTSEEPVQNITGNYIAFANEDGTSYMFDLGEHTITKYSTDDTVLETRKMSKEEQALSPEKLYEKLQSSQTKNIGNQEIAQETTNSSNTRRTKGDGIDVSYRVTENNVEIVKVHNLNQYENPAAKAFCNGLDSVERESDNKYHFRGMASQSNNVLRQKAINKAGIFAAHTAIYQDLQNKVKNGGELTTAEQGFMEKYNRDLTTYGLQMNAAGELEEIPTKKKNRFFGI